MSFAASLKKKISPKIAMVGDEIDMIATNTKEFAANKLFPTKVFLNRSFSRPNSFKPLDPSLFKSQEFQSFA